MWPSHPSLCLRAQTPAASSDSQRDQIHPVQGKSAPGPQPWGRGAPIPCCSQAPAEPLPPHPEQTPLTWSRMRSCCPRSASACCGYLFFRWSMKASRLRSISDFWRPVRASRLWAAMTVCRRSEVCTSPTLEKRRVPLPRVRYSRGYSASSAEIMWVLVLSGSARGEQSRVRTRGGLGCYDWAGGVVS